MTEESKLEGQIELINFRLKLNYKVLNVIIEDNKTKNEIERKRNIITYVTAISSLKFDLHKKNKQLKKIKEGTLMFDVDREELFNQNLYFIGKIGYNPIKHVMRMKDIKNAETCVGIEGIHVWVEDQFDKSDLQNHIKDITCKRCLDKIESDNLFPDDIDCSHLASKLQLKHVEPSWDSLGTKIYVITMKCFDCKKEMSWDCKGDWK